MAAEMFRSSQDNTWIHFLRRLLESWQTESGDAELPVQGALEFLYEACSEGRREFTYGEGVTLCTVHSAKGAEFDHVLVIGPWGLGAGTPAQEEERRTFYVGLTRARKTLAVFDRADMRPSLPEELTAPSVLSYEFDVPIPSRDDTALDYEILSLEDINLGYPGFFDLNHNIHAALSGLEAGDKVTMRSTHGTDLSLFDDSDVCIARLSRRGESEWRERLSSIREIRILAMVRRNAEQDPDLTRRDQYKVSEWEVPIVEIVFGADFN